MYNIILCGCKTDRGINVCRTEIRLPRKVIRTVDKTQSDLFNIAKIRLYSIVLYNIIIIHRLLLTQNTFFLFIFTYFAI